MGEYYTKADGTQDKLSNLAPGEAAFYRFPNSGVIFARVPKDVMDQVDAVIQKMLDTDFKGQRKANYKLTANIAKEFDISEDVIPIITDYIVSLARFHNEVSQPHHANNLSRLISHQRAVFLREMWVNFQKKHEVHPHHNHGGIYSFALWSRVPYKIEDERAMWPESSLPVAGNFAFTYTDIIGQVHSDNFPIDNNFEGMICLFPASLTHMVYPFFTSDDFRVSLSGDLIFDSSIHDHAPTNS